MRGRWGAGRLRTILVLLTLVLGHEPARNACAESARTATREPELTIDDDGDHAFVVNLRNPLPFPITVTVKEKQLRNLRASKEFPITAVIEANRTESLARLTPIERRQRTKADTFFYYRPGRAGAKHDDRFVYTLPFDAGYAYQVTQGYHGTFTHQKMHALDFAMPEGTPICAARDGRIVSVTQKYAEGGTADRFKELCNEFSVLHDDGTIARYAHLRKDGINLLVGDYVRAGYTLGYSGNTGFSSGPHLHFDIICVVDGENFETVPVKFATADATEPITLQEDQVYMRPYKDQAAGERREPKNAAELAAETRPRRALPSLPFPKDMPVQPMTLVLTVFTVSVIFSVGKRLSRRY